VPAHQVRSDAQALGAEPYDIADVTFSHRSDRCSFDTFLDEFDLHDRCVDQLAAIVRAADTGRAAESREAPGLLAISLGLSANIPD
ncbi:chromate resistance protein ChrB domain-containing protein, partial [Salmonella enterica subsp. enterica serovar Minnesota]|uniref:chromate resistance protein ChrB domain-containing protein n=1 Tax=Salmonella enterica TaxID=28901 RepID=UPI003D282BC9